MAAQDAELKLKVSLDLGFFRQQLVGLGQAAAGYNLPVKVQFDRRSVQNELNALGANIRRRNYRLNIETNLSAEIAKADTLARKLEELGRKIQASSGTAFSRGPQGAAGLEKFMREQGLTGRAFGVQQAQENIAKQAILARLEKGSLSKGGYNVAGLEKIIRDLGGTPSGSRKDLAAQAKKLVEESNGIADAVFDSLKDLQMKLRPIRGQAQASAARSMPNLNEMLDRMANLTENPRAAQRMLRMIPESRITTDLVGVANRQAAFKDAGPGQFLNLKGKAFDPLFQAIAKSFTNYTKTVNISDPWIGKIGNGIRDLVTRAAQSLQGGRQAQLALPAAGQSSASRMMRSAFSGLPAIMSPQIGMENAPLSRAATYMLNKARRALEMPIGPSSPYLPSPFAGAATVPPRSFFRFGQGPQLPGAPIQAALPPAGTTTNYGGGGFFGYGGVTGSGGGGRGGAIVPFAGGGAVPPGGGGGGMGGLGGFGRAMGGINLPGSGTIRELGDEFSFAAKQVLLFGTAYKALAFFQNFPAQVGAAVGQLQTFRNTLGAISPTAQEAASSNQLILDLVEKYNVPLQSARDGFTKLYASMAPAGFSGDEIRDLFTGITQAAATFGMSADKVDRVNYAFAQMASKGQVMSEELKGQLGDVLPGAMALFAEAAGFEGPKAIQDFSAALEDGAYKGQAMVTLLKNVGVVMKQEFGPGAEGAARTFQGVINRMQNSMTLLYESFEPVAVGFLNSVVVPLTSGIKQISDGFNAFFTGAAAQTTGGFAIAQELERLRPAFDGIAQNIAGLIDQFGQFARIGLEVGKVLLQIAGNPIVGYLARLYAIALPINIALNVMRGLWAANALQLLLFNARVATGTSTLSAFRGMMAATGATAQTTAASIRTAGITLRTFFATTGVGLVIVGISMLIEKFLSMNQALADTKAKALGAAQAIQSMSKAEARQEEFARGQTVRTLEGLYQKPTVTLRKTGMDKGRQMVGLTDAEAAQLEKAGIPVERGLLGGGLIEKSKIAGYREQQLGLKKQAAYTVTQRSFEEKQMQQQAVLAPIPPSEGDGKTKKGKELDQYIQDATKALDIEKERQLLAVEDKMLRGEISETEAKRQSLLIDKLYEEKAVVEALRVAEIKLKEENLSAADKQLKLADLRAEKEQKVANIRNKFGVETLKMELALQKPIQDAIAGANEQLDEQAMLRENLKGGLTDLTYDQKAYLDVQRLTKDYGDAEKESVRERINEYQKLREEYYKNEEALKKQQGLLEAETGLGIIGSGLRAGFTGSAAGVFERAMEQYGDTDYATQLANVETTAMQLRSVFEGLQGAIGGVSSAFANMLTEGVANMISGTATAKQVFASFLQSVGQALSQAGAQMISTYIAIGIAKAFAGLAGGAGTASQGAGSNPVVPGVNFPMVSAANGAVWKGGFQAFANGGVVKGPTLGLVGEGKYNEAIVPLPDGRSIPVQFNGGRSAREMMNNGGPGGSAVPALNMTFETKTINGVEYVSREQLENAMASTRAAAISRGARQGMEMTLEKLRNSPTTRNSIGMR